MPLCRTKLQGLVQPSPTSVSLVGLPEGCMSMAGSFTGRTWILGIPTSTKKLEKREEDQL